MAAPEACCAACTAGAGAGGRPACGPVGSPPRWPAQKRSWPAPNELSSSRYSNSPPGPRPNEPAASSRGGRGQRGHTPGRHRMRHRWHPPAVPAPAPLAQLPTCAIASRCRSCAGPASATAAAAPVPAAAAAALVAAAGDEGRRGGRGVIEASVCYRGAAGAGRQACCSAAAGAARGGRLQALTLLPRRPRLAAAPWLTRCIIHCPLRQARLVAPAAAIAAEGRGGAGERQHDLNCMRANSTAAAQHMAYSSGSGSAPHPPRPWRSPDW